MLGYGNVSLDALKQGLTSQIHMNNAADNDGYDPTATAVSLFGYDVRRNIQHQATLCNGISNQLLVSSDNDDVESLSSDASSRLAELQETIAWTQGASQDILSQPGLSENAISSAVNTIQQTLNFGGQILVSTVENVNEAVDTAVQTLEKQQREEQAKSPTERHNTNPINESVVESVKQKTQKQINQKTCYAIKIA